MAFASSGQQKRLPDSQTALLDVDFYAIAFTQLTRNDFLRNGRFQVFLDESL